MIYRYTTGLGILWGGSQGLKNFKGDFCLYPTGERIKSFSSKNTGGRRQEITSIPQKRLI